jgi:hypothetical protein
LASRQFDHERDDAAVREIDAVDLVAGLEEHRLLLQFSGLEVRPQQLEVHREQRREQAIGRTEDVMHGALRLGGSTFVSLSH